MFLKQYLGFTNVKSRFLKNQLGFLKEIVTAYLQRIPFQNVTSFGQYKPLDREPPGLREILSANFSGGGGLCAHNNIFLKFQLECIGYDVELVTGCFVRTGIPGSHNMIKVRIPNRLSKEPLETKKSIGFKTYLVDAGCGVPLAEPVCLNDLPYRGVAGGCEYRYEQFDENTIHRVNECGDAIIGKKNEDFKSPQDYTINLKPVQFGRDTKGPISAVYTNPRSIFLHQGLYCFRYLDIRDDDFEIVCIRGMEVIFITKHTRHVQTFNSYKEVHPLVLKYFPMIDLHEVNQTIYNFSLPLENAIALSKNYKGAAKQ